MTELKKYIAAGLCESAGLSKEEILELLEYPPDKALGDIAFPCFRLSKQLRKAPNMIAPELASAFPANDRVTVNAAGPYVNFKLTDKEYARILADIRNKGEDYGKRNTGDGKTVVLDYSSPNIAKTFHIGHLPSTVIGNALRLIHDYEGYKTVSVNHLGDWGTQFGKLVVAFKKWSSKEAVEEGGVSELTKIYVKFHKEAEEHPELEDEARAWFTKMEKGDEEALSYWKWFRDISLVEFNKIYDLIGVKFDSYNGEAFYNDKMEPVVNELKEKGLLKFDDGAGLVDLEEYKMPPCLILKSDGSTLYATRDITAALYRNETYKFDSCIYVTASAQILHFAQWFKVVELMGYDFHKKLHHVPFGMVSLDGEKLSTRAGNMILLSDLFNTAISKVGAVMDEKNTNLANKDEVARKVGVGAIVFNFLYNSRIKDVDFKWDEALNFDGNTGPYAQYTYARACSVLEKAGGTCGGDIVISCDAEKNLILEMAMLPERIAAAIRDLEPSYVTRCLISVCKAFNTFYHDCSIAKEEDEKLRASRIAITSSAKTIIGVCLKLIGLECINKI